MKYGESRKPCTWTPGSRICTSSSSTIAPREPAEPPPKISLSMRILVSHEVYLEVVPSPVQRLLPAVRPRF